MSKSKSSLPESNPSLDIYLSLLEDTWREFNLKAQVEWKFNYVIWAFLAALIVLLFREEIVLPCCLFAILAILIILVIFGHYSFLSWIHKTHERHRNIKGRLIKKISEFVNDPKELCGLYKMNKRSLRTRIIYLGITVVLGCALLFFSIYEKDNLKKGISVQQVRSILGNPLKTKISENQIIFIYKEGWVITFNKSGGLASYEIKK